MIDVNSVLVEGSDAYDHAGQARCRECGALMTLDRPFGRCGCGNSDLEWLAGAELRIKEMEVD